MAFSLFIIIVAVVLLGIVAPLAIWASIGEAQEKVKTERFFREWDAETARLRQLSQRMSDRRSGGVSERGKRTMAAARAKQRHNNRYQKEVERYTPTWLLQRVATFLGPDYLDPCPASEGNAPKINGLEIPWTGNVWVNPPYRPIAPWITKAMSEPVNELLLLVPAYTETQWFRPLFAHPMCFIHGRLRFRRPGDGRAMEYLPHAPHPTVLVYRGEHLQKFADAFADIGPITQTYRPQRIESLWREVDANKGA